MRVYSTRIPQSCALIRDTHRARLYTWPWADRATARVCGCDAVCARRRGEAATEERRGVSTVHRTCDQEQDTDKTTERSEVPVCHVEVEAAYELCVVDLSGAIPIESIEQPLDDRHGDAAPSWHAHPVDM